MGDSLAASLAVPQHAAVRPGIARLYVGNDQVILGGVAWPQWAHIQRVPAASRQHVTIGSKYFTLALNLSPPTYNL